MDKWKEKYKCCICNCEFVPGLIIGTTINSFCEECKNDFKEWFCGQKMIKGIKK